MTFSNCLKQKNSSEHLACSKELIREQLKVICECTDYLTKNQPILFPIDCNIKEDIFIKLKIKDILLKLCPDIIENKKFKEFSIIFLLDIYFNDIKYFHQGYNLLDRLEYPFTKILLSIYKEQKINYFKNENFFTSGEIFSYYHLIDNNESNNISYMIFKIDSLTKKISIKNGWDLVQH